MTTDDLAQVEAGLKALAGIDFQGVLTAFRSGDAQGELQTAEQVADLLAAFFPPAEYVKDGLVALSFVAALYQAGLIRSASPDDPAMTHAEGRRGFLQAEG